MVGIGIEYLNWDSEDYAVIEERCFGSEGSFLALELSAGKF